MTALYLCILPPPLRATKKTITVKKSATLKLKKKKGGQTIKLKSSYVKVSTSKKSVATVKAVKKSGKVISYKVSAKKAGKATITIKVKKGTYKGTYKCKVTVKAAPKPTAKPTAKPTNSPTQTPSANPSTDPSTNPSAEPTKDPSVEVSKVEAGVSNAIKGYENTVLVNNSAIIKVKATDKDGNPVAGESVVLTKKDVNKGNSATEFEIKGNAVATTNAEGVATFVVGNKNAVKSNDSAAVGTVVCNIVSSNGVVGKVNAKFASVDIRTSNSATSSVHYVNTDDAYDAFPENKGGNASENYNVTHDMTGKSVEFVSSQQASPAGTDKNKVKFYSAPYITVPGDEASKAMEFVQPVTDASGEYKTNAWLAKSFKLDVNPSDLSYATLNFANLQLSQYTTLNIDAFPSKWDMDHEWSGGTKIAIDEIRGSYDKKDFGVQIPVEKITGNDVYIRVKLESKGQVNLKENAGFTLKNVKGVYKTAAAGVVEEMKNATVTWKTVTPDYSKEAALPAGNVKNKLDTVEFSGKGYTYTYQMPVFPYTGNAIITVKDANKKVIAYYACPVKNKQKTATTYENENVLNDVAASCYRISEDEAFKSVGTITQDGNAVIANSENAGITTLVGEISGDDSLDLDATNDKVYTSVQWNPIPEAEADHDALFALKGQSVEVVAQLVDGNGNKVSTSGDVTFEFTANSNVTNSDTTVTTDSTGKAVLTVSSAKKTVLKNVTAKSSKYKVIISVGDQQMSVADVYWLDGNLSFTSSTYDAIEKKTSNGDTVVDTGINPKSGESWEYAFDVEYERLTDGVLSGKDVRANFNVGVDTSNKDVTSDIGNGKATVTSKAAGKVELTGKINTASVSKDTTVSIQYEGKTYKLVGTGNTTIDKTLKLDVNYTVDGEQMDFHTLFGTKYAESNTAAKNLAYVKVTDKNGNALADKTVKFTATGATLDKASTSISNATDTVAAGTVTTKTDADGIAVINIAGFTQDQATIVAVTDDSAAIRKELHISKTSPSTLFEIKSAKYEKSSDGKSTIVLEFSDGVQEGSVVKEMLSTVSYKVSNAGTAKEYTVNGVTVSGNKVTLTLNSTLSDVANNDTFGFTITPFQHQDSTPTADRNTLYMVTSANGAILDDVVTVTGLKADGTNATSGGVVTDASDSTAQAAIPIKVNAAVNTFKNTTKPSGDYKINKTAYDAAVAVIEAVAGTATAANVDTEISTAVSTATTAVNKLKTDAQLIAAVKTAIVGVPITGTAATDKTAIITAIKNVATDTDGNKLWNTATAVQEDLGNGGGVDWTTVKVAVYLGGADFPNSQNINFNIIALGNYTGFEKNSVGSGWVFPEDRALATEMESDIDALTGAGLTYDAIHDAKEKYDNLGSAQGLVAAAKVTTLTTYAGIIDAIDDAVTSAETTSVTVSTDLTSTGSEASDLINLVKTQLGNDSLTASDFDISISDDSAGYTAGKTIKISIADATNTTIKHEASITLQ